MYERSPKCLACNAIQNIDSKLNYCMAYSLELFEISIKHFVFNHLQISTPWYLNQRSSIAAHLDS